MSRMRSIITHPAQVSPKTLIFVQQFLNGYRRSSVFESAKNIGISCDIKDKPGSNCLGKCALGGFLAFLTSEQKFYLLPICKCVLVKF